MRSPLAVCMTFALVLVASGCDKKKEAPSKPEPIATRADCEKVMDHVAGLITRQFASDPEKLWDGLADTSAFEAQGVTKETFKDFLQKEGGKAFLAERRGAARKGMAQDLERCAKAWTKSMTDCMLKGTDQQSVEKCFPGK